MNTRQSYRNIAIGCILVLAGTIAAAPGATAQVAGWNWLDNGNTTYAGTAAWFTVATAPPDAPKLALAIWGAESDADLSGDRSNYDVDLQSSSCTITDRPWTDGPEEDCYILSDLASDWTLSSDTSSSIDPDCDVRYLASSRAVQLEDITSTEDCAVAVFSSDPLVGGDSVGQEVEETPVGTPPVGPQTVTTPGVGPIPLTTPDVPVPKQCAPSDLICVGPFTIPGQDFGETPPVDEEEVTTPPVPGVHVITIPGGSVSVAWGDVRGGADPHAGETETAGPITVTIPVFGGIPVTVCDQGCEVPKSPEASLHTEVTVTVQFAGESESVTVPVDLDA